MESGVFKFHRSETHSVGLLNLMPWPQDVKFDSKTYVKAKNLDGQMKIDGWNERSEYGKYAELRLNQRLQNLWGKGSPSGHPESCTWKEDGVTFSVQVSCKSEFSLPSLNMNEEYTLKIDDKGLISVSAESGHGVLRAFVTIAQLLTTYNGDAYFPLVEIKDKPSLKWRGLMLDVSRHFHPIEQIVSLLDGMEFVKLNVFHWHLSDDQGFRVESKVFPKLHTQASEGEYFTQEQVKLVIKEATARGIRVVPEFDMPAHNGAVLLAYPELCASKVGPTSLPKTWGVLPWVLDPTNDAVYDWIQKFLTEMTSLFPDDYFHIGGDEVPSIAWKEPSIKSWMKIKGIQSQHDLQHYFTHKVMLMLGKLGKRLVGWDEITIPALPKNVTIQIWRGWVPGIAGKVSRQGLQSVMSAELYLDWTRPIKHYYKQSPHSNQAGRVGGEACMWSEWASHNVDNRIWPTMAAIAERLWRKDTPFGGHAQMYGRMFGMSKTLSLIGIRHLAVYELALDTLISGKPYDYGDVLKWNKVADTPLKKLVRRLINALQPVNRVGGGEKHDLIHIPDALRPDSLEMRALGFLCEKVTEEKFQNQERVSILKAYLAKYSSLNAELLKKNAFSKRLLSKAQIASERISAISSKAEEMLQALSEGNGAKASSLKNQLLRMIVTSEETTVGGNKLIIEFAHVIETMLAGRIK